MAVEVNVTIEGVEEFQAAMQKFDSGMQRQVHSFLLNWAKQVEMAAKGKAPVRTGYLQSSIYSTVKNWVAEVGAEATYALFVELGTRHMRARPYLIPALQEHLPELEMNIIGAIEQAKAEAGL